MENYCVQFCSIVLYWPKTGPSCVYLSILQMKVVTVPEALWATQGYVGTSVGSKGERHDKIFFEL
jgi:hypothetical protein